MEKTKVFAIIKTVKHTGSWYSSNSQEVVGFCVSELDAKYNAYKLQKDNVDGYGTTTAYTYDQLSAIETEHDNKNFKKFVIEERERLTKNVESFENNLKDDAVFLNKLKSDLEYINTLG